MAPPLLAQNETGPITIGYGAGGGFPFRFSLPGDESSDTGFVKLFVSTVYIDLDWVAQPCPFQFADSRAVHREEIPIFGSREAVITLSRGSSL